MSALKSVMLCALALTLGACRSGADDGSEPVKPGCPDSYLEAGEWKATDDQSASGRRFYVSGAVVVPTAGYSVDLKKRAPQGINPSVLLLDLTVIKPTGMSAQVVTTAQPRYDESPYAGTYKSVEIYCGQDRIAAPVIHVMN